MELRSDMGSTVPGQVEVSLLSRSDLVPGTTWTLAGGETEGSVMQGAGTTLALQSL